MLHQFSRNELVIGTEGLEILKSKRVGILGVGGVGSFAAESLARSGVGSLVLMDKDDIDITNVNRQIHATTETVGCSKVEEMKKRILAINPECEVELVKKLIADDIEEVLGNFEKVENLEESKDLDNSKKNCKYDFVVDAIDVIGSKVNLIEYCVKNKINIISSMGFGNKMHPEMVEIAKIKNTSVCPMARTIRSILKKKNISIGRKHETPLDDLYDCEIDGNPFTIVRTEEETFLYTECTDTIEKLLKIFE